MKSFLEHKVILWDFDGVIMDSMPTRSRGFEMVLDGYPTEQVEQLMQYHNLNGGLSRYVKFRYFFEKIRGESITQDNVLTLASKFSDIMLKSLINEDLLINDSISFIDNNWKNYLMHIVSGSDGVELRQICDSLDLSKYFKSINGSPTPKKDLVRNLISDYQYNIDDVILIGDSINDAEAADVNGIRFFAYNNILLKSHYEYIDQLNLMTNQL